MPRLTHSAAILLLAAWLATPAAAQIKAPGEEGSRNVHVYSHVPLGKAYTIGDIEVEQELSRPYAYVMRTFGEAGFDLLDMKDLRHARTLYQDRKSTRLNSSHVAIP